MILIDTSIWIDHFSKTNDILVRLLEDEEVSGHPLVVGELAVGNLQNRKEILRLIENLPSVRIATASDVIHFIERHRLMGRGLGIVDVHLLASVVITDATQLWTNDKRLNALAQEMGVAFT